MPALKEDEHCIPTRFERLPYGVGSVEIRRGEGDENTFVRLRSDPVPNELADFDFFRDPASGITLSFLFRQVLWGSFHRHNHSSTGIIKRNLPRLLLEAAPVLLSGLVSSKRAKPRTLTWLVSAWVTEDDIDSLFIEN